MTILEQTNWCNHTMLKKTITTQTGRSITFQSVLPSRANAQHPWIIAMHGYGSSLKDWLEFDGYTKGGNLICALANLGYAVAMTDMDLHGDNIPEGEVVDYDALFAEDAWRAFVHNSLENIQAVVDTVQQDATFIPGRLGCVTYSLGGLMAFGLANKGLAFRTMTMCVPPVLRQDNGPFPIQKNLSHVSIPSLLFLAGDHDDITPLADSQWLFDQLPIPDKQFRSYSADHSLPVEYVSDAVEWIKQRL